jgi:predicted Zn-dependent protease
MSQADSSTIEERKSSARRYFIAATILLFLLASTWAIDESFVYLFGGVIVFLLFMGFSRWPWQFAPKNTSSGRQYQPPPPNPNRDFHEFLRNMFTPKTGQATDTQPAPNRVKIIFWVIGGFIFFIIVSFSLLLSDDDHTTGDDNLYQQAVQYAEAGQFELARETFKSHLRENPDDAEAYFQLGNAFGSQEQRDSAIACYDKALSLNAALDGARYNKGWHYYQQKKYDEAIRELLTLRERNPAYLDGIQLMGDVYYDQKKYDQAIQWYEEAYSKGQRGNWICYVLGYLYQEKGDTQRAISLYKEALTYDSSVTDIYQRLGELLPGNDGQYYRNRGAKQN